jgi:hypothetical protein
MQEVKIRMQSFFLFLQDLAGHLRRHNLPCLIGITEDRIGEIVPVEIYRPRSPWSDHDPRAKSVEQALCGFIRLVTRGWAAAILAETWEVGEGPW